MQPYSRLAYMLKQTVGRESLLARVLDMYTVQAHVSSGREYMYLGCVVPVYSPGECALVRPWVHRHMYLPAIYH
jgi:hypothetical protein